MAAKIIVVGIGPGHPDYIPPIASRAIQAAQVLIGSRRALETFADPAQKQVEITGTLSIIVDVIRQYYQTRSVTVMVSGDPGFYSLLSYLLKHFKPAELEIIPGIGSMQMAFCRAKTVWQDARLVSLHGRKLENVGDLLVEPGKIGFLTDSQHSPAVIASYLLNLGWPNCTVYLCEKLSYPEERVLQTDLNSAVHEVGFTDGIMVVMEHA